MKEVVETTMSRKEKLVHPYIPNSVPEIKAELMEEIGITAIEELYRVIPDELRLKRKLNLPEPFLAEYELQKACQRNSFKK